MGFLPPFRKKYPKKYQKKNADATEKGTFFPTIRLVSPLAKTRAFPSALLRLAKDAPARRRVRSMKPRVISTRRVRERPARFDVDPPARVFGRNSSLGMCLLRFSFSVQKVQFANTHTKKRSITILSPKRLFSRKARPTTTKKRAEKLSSFFESALESARRPSFSSSREGGFFGCRFAVSAMRLIRPRRFFCCWRFPKQSQKREAKM